MLSGWQHSVSPSQCFCRSFLRWPKPREVAPGVRVTWKTFPAPVNEAPFYGFVDKSLTLRRADDVFVSIAVDMSGSSAAAFEAAAADGWQAIAANDMAEAGRHFNRAWLISPEQSQIFHGFAVLAAARFNDTEFAEELFRIARRQPGKLETLNTDYGRMLLTAKRPLDAEPVLEQAVKDAPAFANAWSNLAIARLQNGDAGGACLAADKAGKLQDAGNDMDIKRIRREARCSGH
jgi:predicted Zn-dependent protease